MSLHDIIKENTGFEPHLGLRFFMCPLMVDSLHLPVFSFKNEMILIK